MAKAATARPGHNSGTLWLRRAYNFVDRDPECDRFKTMFEREHIKESEVAVVAGLATSTVKNLFRKDGTRKPQHATLAKLAGGMGYEYGLQRKRKPDYATEVVQAREEKKAYLAAQARKKEREANRNGKKG